MNVLSQLFGGMVQIWSNVAFVVRVFGALMFKPERRINFPLFRIACVDKDLDHEEHEMIRKISGLMQIEHKDFIDAKIRIKKEFGLDTAGL